MQHIISAIVLLMRFFYRMFKWAGNSSSGSRSSDAESDNVVKYSVLKKNENNYICSDNNDFEIATLSYIFTDDLFCIENLYNVVIHHKITSHCITGKLYLTVMMNNVVYVRTCDENEEPIESIDNKYRMIIHRDTLALVINAGIKRMQKKSSQLVIMYYNNHYFVSDYVPSKRILNSIIENPSNNKCDIVCIADYKGEIKPSYISFEKEKERCVPKFYDGDTLRLFPLQLFFFQSFDRLQQCKELIAQEEDSSWCNGIIQFGSINGFVCIKMILDENVSSEELHIVLFKDDFITLVDEVVVRMQKKSPYVILMLYKDHIFVIDRLLSPNALNFIIRYPYHNYFGIRPIELPNISHCQT